MGGNVLEAFHRIDYHNRRFRTVASTSNGEASEETVFSYRQRGDVVWGTYEGGPVVFGTLVASVDAEGNLDMRYSHVAVSGLLQTGTCLSTPEVLHDGRLRLLEEWRWTCGDGSEGTSVIEEISGS